jgi:hypothetical protein
MCQVCAYSVLFFSPVVVNPLRDLVISLDLPVLLVVVVVVVVVVRRSLCRSRQRSSCPLAAVVGLLPLIMIRTIKSF